MEINNCKVSLVSYFIVLVRGCIKTNHHAIISGDNFTFRKQQLLYHLNSSGKYFAFKEQLKHAVVKIVREKYLKTTAFQDRDELQVCNHGNLKGKGGIISLSKLVKSKLWLESAWCYSGPYNLRPPIQPAKYGLKLKVVLK